MPAGMPPVFGEDLVRCPLGGPAAQGEQEAEKRCRADQALMLACIAGRELVDGCRLT